MIYQKVHIPEWDWSVDVFYECSPRDADIIEDALAMCGCEGPYLSRARKNLQSGMPNSGLTYSNMEERKSVVVISRTTSADEFQNTFDHEKGHLAMHISQALGIDPFSEEFEYLTGEIGRHLFKVAKNLLCEHCRRRVMSLPIRSKKLS